MFTWSQSGLLDFLAYSGVLITITENLTVLYMLAMLPWCILRKVVGQTISAAVFGGIAMLAIILMLNSKIIDFARFSVL
jgi:hypothetical protein